MHTELGKSQVEVQRCTLSWAGPREAEMVEEKLEEEEEEAEEDEEEEAEEES